MRVEIFIVKNDKEVFLVKNSATACIASNNLLEGHGSHNVIVYHSGPELDETIYETNSKKESRAIINYVERKLHEKRKIKEKLRAYKREGKKETVRKLKQQLWDYREFSLKDILEETMGL